MNDRKKYWNEDYYDYWNKRVEEANISNQNESTVLKGDTIVPGDQTIEWLIRQSNIRNGNLLEVGCGYGRLFKLYSILNLDVYAIDISKKMVEEANKNKLENIIEIRESEAENIPYLDNHFDYTACIATFDATYQERSLAEMMRVLKLNGIILITGKNIEYYEDDELAKEAEKGARRKGEPNYFTNIRDLKFQLRNKEHTILLEYYFLRRGDFAKLEFVEEMPERFYEYFFVIQKLSEKVHFKKFSNNYSNVKGGRE